MIIHFKVKIMTIETKYKPGHEVYMLVGNAIQYEIIEEVHFKAYLDGPSQEVRHSITYTVKGISKYIPESDLSGSPKELADKLMDEFYKRED